MSDKGLVSIAGLRMSRFALLQMRHLAHFILPREFHKNYCFGYKKKQGAWASPRYPREMDAIACFSIQHNYALYPAGRVIITYANTEDT